MLAVAFSYFIQIGFSGLYYCRPTQSSAHHCITLCCGSLHFRTCCFFFQMVGVNLRQNRFNSSANNRLLKKTIWLENKHSKTKKKRPLEILSLNQAEAGRATVKIPQRSRMQRCSSCWSEYLKYLFRSLIKWKARAFFVSTFENLNLFPHSLLEQCLLIL